MALLNAATATYPPCQATAKLLDRLQSERAADAQLARALGVKCLSAWQLGARQQRADREAAARHAQAWGKVRGWLSEARARREAEGVATPVGAMPPSSAGADMDGGGVV